MACWQDLYEMLIDDALTPEQIVARLNVPPSRLKRMLASKRLAASLARRAKELAASPDHPSADAKDSQIGTP